MSVGAISAAGLGQEVYAASSSPQQQALQTLQNSLATGNLTTAQSAFQALQAVLQNSATASGTSLASNSQLSNDLTALGSAIGSGDLQTAQSAFASVLGDLKTTASAAQTNEATAASESLQLVNGLLGSLNSTASTTGSTDNTTALLQSYYAGKSGLNVYA